MLNFWPFNRIAKSEPADPRLSGVPQDSPNSTGRGLVVADTATAISKMFAVSNERTLVHRDMHRMDRECELVKKALDMIASRALGYSDPTVNSFTVVIEDRDPQPSDSSGNRKQSSDAKLAQRIAEDLIERAKLRPNGWQIIRKSVKWGNDFREVLFDADENGRYLRVAGLKPLPEQTVWPNTDQMGNRIPGYSQANDGMPPDENSIQFPEYKILHFMFGEEDGYLGTPLMIAARKNWNRLGMAEDSTAVARITRAFTKFLHRVPVSANDPIDKQKQSIAEYKAAMKSRKIWDDENGNVTLEDNPTTVNTDFYIPEDGTKRGGVEMFDPENAQLQNVTDLEYYAQRIIDATTMPMRYFAISSGAPKLSEGGGTAEDVNFACTLLMCHQMLQAGYDKLFAIEFALHGLDWRRFRIVYRMADLSTTDQLKAAQRDKAKSSTLEEIVKVLPGMLKQPGVILREYTSMSDASITKLLEDKKLTDGALDIIKASPKKDTRIQLPGGGEEGRTKE